MTRVATEEELRDLWALYEKWWEGFEGKIDTPWTRATFIMAQFNLGLKQRGWRVPPTLGSHK